MVFSLLRVGPALRGGLSSAPRLPLAHRALAGRPRALGLRPRAEGSGRPDQERRPPAAPAQPPPHERATEQAQQEEASAQAQAPPPQLPESMQELVSQPCSWCRDRRRSFKAGAGENQPLETAPSCAACLSWALRLGAADEGVRPAGG